MCQAGEGPNLALAATSCVACSPGEYSVSGTCSSCQTGKIPNAGKTACEACPTGKTADLTTAGTCSKCTEGYFAFQAGDKCTSCDSIIDGEGVVWPVKDADGQLASRPKCPGGVPGSTAGVCFLAGHYFHTSAESSTTKLLKCESMNACVVSDQSSVVATTEQQFEQNYTALNCGGDGRFGGICGAGYEGPMCRQCSDGFTKVRGNLIHLSGVSLGSLWQLSLTDLYDMCRLMASA